MTDYATVARREARARGDAVGRVQVRSLIGVVVL